MDFDCKECGGIFNSEKSLHLHLKKHGLYQAEYYCKHHPRKSLLYGRPIPFKSKKEYFNTNFIDYKELSAWINSESPEKIKPICLDLLKQRIEEKKYKFAPPEVELKTLSLPSISHFKRLFGTFGAVCKELKVEPLFGDVLPPDFKDFQLTNQWVLVDTREQDPLYFPKTTREKLYVGDYLMKDSYSYTFIDRKSAGDFIGTMTSGKERFEKEVEKAVQLNGYLFVVVESTIDEVNGSRYCKKNTLFYVWHEMRALMHKFPRRIQFIFTGHRSKSQELIPKLLCFGDKVWGVDFQYYLNYNKV